MVSRSDILIENYRPGVAEKLGIGYEDCQLINPRLIYASISGFGQSGPMMKAPSYDVVAQALSGLMSITGQPDGGPIFVGDSIGDSISGIYAALAIAVGLYYRSVSQTGTRIDVAMFDCLFSLLPTALAKMQVDGCAPGRVGNHHPLSAPFGAFSASDGHFVIAIANQKLFFQLCHVMGQDDLMKDERFLSDQLRRQNLESLELVINTWAAQYTCSQVVSILSNSGIPASEIWNVAQAAESEQTQVRALYHNIPHPDLGKIQLPEQPIHFSGQSRGTVRYAPNCGENTDEILSEILGYTDVQINNLKKGKVI